MYAFATGAFMQYYGVSWGLPLIIALLLIIELIDAINRIYTWRHNRKVIKMDNEAFVKWASRVRKANPKKGYQPKLKEFYDLDGNEEKDEEKDEQKDEEGNTILVVENPELQIWEWDVNNK